MLVLHCVGVGSFDTSCLRRLAVAGGGSFHHGCDAGIADHLQGIFCRLSASVSALRGTLLELGDEALKPLPAKLLEAPEAWKTASQKELDDISQPCWSWPCVETPGSSSGSLVPQGDGKRMFLHRQPFAQGALRYAFHFRSVQGCPAEPGGKVVHLVVKESKYATGHRSPEDVRKFFLQNHRRAEELAREFNQAVRSMKERDKDESAIREIQFVKAHVMQISDPAEDSAFRYVTAEKYIPGPYMKFNGNDGFVNRVSGGEAGQIAAAFSHFTFDHTGGKELCVDIQGVGTRWTDPQINSRARKFGVADLGEAGMRRFFQSHSCGRMCWSLQLRTVSPQSLQFGEVVRPPQPCVVCLSAPRTQVCLPCRHLCLCDECAPASLWPAKCPICRRGVEGLVPLGAEAPGGPTFLRESQLARMMA
ncbi:unnamed protein product [Prorocentrum cordatum]|uniref:Alpha-type protein kinase domain-containing protein n=1 Tax=Prorocentrum cordatum TaxID=2364126 RepID=A0ABN9UX63_9DINO|nr:unnamed protein product [Polarella glacialis]